jgi:hypothetical protein
MHGRDRQQAPTQSQAASVATNSDLNISIISGI